MKPDAPKQPVSRIEIIESPVLRRLSWLVHGFSTRAAGVTTCYGAPSLNLGFTQADTREHVIENRRRWLIALGAATKGKPWPLVTNRQIHSDVVHVVRSVPSEPLAGDGLITDLAGVALAILTADCLPVLLADRKKKVIGAFHAGWRGTVQRIVEKGLGIMRRDFGSRPEDVFAAVGPGIQNCCYEVGEELKERFESQFPYARDLFHEVQDSDPVREKYPLLFMNQRAPGHGDLCIKIHLNLREANRRQLVEAGVPAKQISTASECTACDTGKFFSHRAEKGHTGRMMAVMGIKP
ncbi:MAG TPA: peptidoglycan editing factor PgeF [Candidatus Angelobacter sp.]|nr:peptidoglycan editing factor PgeF [Candidatus Angelobacter sp.]